MNKEKINERVNEILSVITDKVSVTSLERLQEAGIESNSLPKNGVFGSFITAGEQKGTDDFRHLRMTVKDSTDTISTANLRIVAPRSSDKKLVFGKITKEGKLKDKLYLKGKSVNPQFAKYSTLEMIAFLEGKAFQATEVSVNSLQYNALGYSTEEDATKNIIAKTAFVVTLTDVE